MKDKYTEMFESMLEEKTKEPILETKLYSGNIDQISEDYSKDTIKFIDDVLKDADDKVKKFLNGLKKFVQDNGFLTPAQRQGLASVSKKGGE